MQIVATDFGSSRKLSLPLRSERMRESPLGDLIMDVKYEQQFMLQLPWKKAATESLPPDPLHSIGIRYQLRSVPVQKQSRNRDLLIYMFSKSSRVLVLCSPGEITPESMRIQSESVAALQKFMKQLPRISTVRSNKLCRCTACLPIHSEA